MTFLVERRRPNVNAVDQAMLHEPLVFACDRLTSRGKPVRCLGAAHFPQVWAAPAGGLALTYMLNED